MEVSQVQPWRRELQKITGRVRVRVVNLGEK